MNLQDVCKNLNLFSDRGNKFRSIVLTKLFLETLKVAFIECIKNDYL